MQVPVSEAQLAFTTVAVPGVTPPGALMVNTKVVGVLARVTNAVFAVPLVGSAGVTPVQALKGKLAGNKELSAAEIPVVAIRACAVASAKHALLAERIV